MPASNQVSVLLDATQLPVRTMDQVTFDAAWAYLMANLPTFGNQLNAAIASYNAASAGTAYAIPYTIDLSGTSDVDPGNGKLRFDNVNQNAASTLRLDLLNNLGSDCTAILDTFDASTSTVKGTIRVVKQGDATKFLIFNVTARSAPSGYRDVSVTAVASSAANPFVAGDAVLLFFQRNGDKGDIGALNTFPVLHLREEQASGTAGTTPTSLSVGLFRRPLNVAKVNEIAGASLASNQFVLPAGSFSIEALGFSLVNTGSPGQVYYHKMALYNVTDGTYTVIGINAVSSAAGGSSYYQSSDASLQGKFTIAASKTFELRHLTPNAGLTAAPAAATGQVEVYTDVYIQKVA